MTTLHELWSLKYDSTATEKRDTPPTADLPRGNKREETNEIFNMVTGRKSLITDPTEDKNNKDGKKDEKGPELLKKNENTCFAWYSKLKSTHLNMI